ncbi:MAG: response regulator, partial [Desulfobacterales bacterium]|nr:response regulator [Desulfobacterales bacterium]
IGIPADKLDRIFESFSQADASTTRKFGGTGLGLAITKSLVELMDGRIWIESEVGEGSAFIFALRLPRQEKMRETEEAPADVKGKRILIVDDCPTNRLICSELLTDFGALGAEAENGTLALEKLTRADQRGEPYHVMLLDLKMPDMHGFQVVERMGAMELKAPPAIIIITSSESPEDKTFSRELHVAGYIVKPFRRSDLLDRILVALGRKAPGMDADKIDNRAGEARVSALKILLAEDIAANRKVVRLFLKNTPADIDMAKNGKIALEMYIQGEYDVVLMDIQMPVMDGREAARAIREWEAENGAPATPIIALTAHAFKKQKKECMAAGCTGFLTKPVKKKDLLAALAELSVKGAAPVPEMENEAGGGESAEAPPN